MKIHILLPAYNEEKDLPPLATKISKIMEEHNLDYSVLVVDDGSSDRTFEIAGDLAKQMPLTVIRHKMNRGLGETVRDGFEALAERSEKGDIIVRMDCDDTHDPKYILPMIQKIREGNEVVTTSRYAPGGGQVGVDGYRQFISRCANLLLKTFFPIPGVLEYSCGYRAYRAELIQDAIQIFGNRFISLMGMGFTCTVEKMIKFKMMGVRVAEVPFILRYDQKRGTSKVLTNITTLGYLTLIAKYVIYWGPVGKQWKRLIKARKKQMYTRSGKLRK